jgi:flavin reductase (DIM6/NTAB) family NADH-FMN oxidoreductase RutF
VRTRLDDLRRAYRLINHGPSTLVSARANGRTNVMAAAWVMAIDFEPARLVAVLARDTFTRGLVVTSREFVVNLPTVAQAHLAWTVGSESGADVDKLQRYGIRTAPAATVEAPLIEGCVGWLECKVLDEPGIQDTYDLFVAQVSAAWYDKEVFDGREWNFTKHPERRTIHHLGRGVFYATGERIVAEKLEPR